MSEVVFAPIVLDGTHGEGGGALVRAALVMSALTTQPLRIQQVRGNLRAQGLQPEDLALVEVLRQSTRAETIGCEAGSTEFSFLPTRRARAVDMPIEVPEAYDGAGHANALVIINSLLPVLARTGAYSFLNAHGETFGMSALSYDAFSTSTLGALRRMGLHAESDLVEGGYGRGSRGLVRVEIEPSVIEGVDWSSRGELYGIRAVLSYGELPESIADRAVSFLERLAHHSGTEMEIEAIRVKSKSPGIHLTIAAEFEQGFGGSQSMGAKGLRVESVVQSGFERFREWFLSESTVDEFLIDQLIVAAAIAENPSTFKVNRLTQRFLTTVWVIKQFGPFHITVKGHEGEAGVVSIRR
jgi:RNA 3'-terminal phosphate cyclase (ATP)